MHSILKLAIVGSIALHAIAPCHAAILVNNETFSTITAGDEADFVAQYPLFSYAESANNGSNVRAQDAPFNNGGTMFIADVANTEQTVTLHASAFAGSAAYDTSTALTLQAGMASNFGTGVLSGILVGGVTGDLLITFNPGGSTYDAGLWNGFASPDR